MGKELTYNADFMDNVSQNYEHCADKVQEAIDEFNDVKKQLDVNYEGQGNYMADDLFSKIIEHLEFLCSCIKQTGKYVTYAKESMQQSDSSLINKN